MSSTGKAIIVSGANETYFSLAQDLFTSIITQKFDVTFDLGILDVGLSEASKDWLTSQAIQVKQVNHDIEFPARAVFESEKPSFRIFTASPFLRKYFPGYDVYVWLDADIWVQTPEAINTLITETRNSPAIHISCELDRCYQSFFKNASIWQAYHEWYAANFDEMTSTAMTLKPMMNVGVYAMSQHSPVWDAWLHIYSQALQHLTVYNSKSFMAHQLALNISLYQHNMPHVVLPASYNWLTALALPMLDTTTGLYVEPAAPYRPISQLHLTRAVKAQNEKIMCRDGSFVERPLTYRARQA